MLRVSFWAGCMFTTNLRMLRNNLFPLTSLTSERRGEHCPVHLKTSLVGETVHVHHGGSWHCHLDGARGVVDNKSCKDCWDC